MPSYYAHDEDKEHMFICMRRELSMKEIHNHVDATRLKPHERKSKKMFIVVKGQRKCQVCHQAFMASLFEKLWNPFKSPSHKNKFSEIRYVGKRFRKNYSSVAASVVSVSSSSSLSTTLPISATASAPPWSSKSYKCACGCLYLYMCVCVLYCNSQLTRRVVSRVVSIGSC